MSDGPPKLAQLNLVVGDMNASLDFYRRLGAATEDSGPHAELGLPDGFTLELDTLESVRLWHAGVRADPATGRVVMGFALESREAVDARYAELTAAGSPVDSRPSTLSGAAGTPSWPTPTATTSA